jgi:hypothetical protein
MGGPAVTPGPNMTPPPDPNAMPPGAMPGGPPQMYPSAPQQVQPQQPQQGPSPSDIENYAAAVHHSRLANALNAATDLLGGSKSLRLVRNPDGSVDVQEGQATPGEKWGRIAKAALQGAATGFAVGQGPGGPQRAAAASVQQGMAMPQQQKDQTLAEAEKANDQNQKRQLFNANLAMMHQNLVKAQFDNMAAPIKFSEEQTQHALQMRDLITKMGGSMLAEYKTPDELAAHVNTNQQMVAGHLGTNGMTVPITNYDGQGHVTGGQAWFLPEDKRQQLNTEAVDIPQTKLNNDGTTTTTTLHVGKGQMTNEQILAALMGKQDEANKVTATGSQMQAQQIEAKSAQERADTEKKLAPSEIALRGATAGKESAEAAKAREETRLLPEQVAAKSQANNATLNMLDNKYVSPAREIEKSWQLADNTYKEYQQLRAQGKDFPTGAESMLMMSRHLQSTFGQVKGSRVTKDMIAEHFGARSVSDDVLAAVQHLTDGDRLSPNQWTAFHKLIGESRNASWQEVADAAQSRGVDATRFLPPDLGGPQRAITIPPNPGGAPGPAPAAPAPGPAAGGGAAAPGQQFNWNQFPTKAP